MKLSPLDIQHMEFTRSVPGYNRRQVRDFLERVADEQEDLIRAVQSVRDELERQIERMEELQAAEADLKRAVIAAERIGNQIKENARKEAELVVKEAEQLKEEIVRDAERRLRSARAELSRLERAQTVFREQFRGMLQGFERSLDNLPAVQVLKEPEPTTEVAEPSKLRQAGEGAS
jgi:cell division initiation protein